MQLREPGDGLAVVEKRGRASAAANCIDLDQMCVRVWVFIFSMSQERANEEQDTVPHYLGRKNIQHMVRYALHGTVARTVGVTRKGNVVTFFCEICKGPAVDRTPPGSDGVKINCPTCGNYAIAGSVLNRFRELEIEARRRALEKAKTRTSLGRPFITSIEH
jgi:hypothetical protein